MNSQNRWFRLQTVSALALVSAIGIAWTARFMTAQTAAAPDPIFDQQIKPFLQKNCATCHNVDNMTAGVRVDHLDTSFDDSHIRFWEGIRHRVENGTMPPKGLPQPSAAERKVVVDWVRQGLEIARLRPSPKNGLVRRLTVAQYRNTLRELLQLDDDLTEIVPPDAVSKDGFVNNKDTLHLSPLLLEAYFDIADKALSRSIVDPKSKPEIQNFRVDLAESVNPNPIPEQLILGAGSALLPNKDVLVTQLTARKPFAFEPFMMRTKYRFIEGYAGNDTVRGWRDFDSIYHAVFADMRGSDGYPKGEAYGLAPDGLLLRPSIPNEELFDSDGTYGPKANFKISLRELPDNGRFRVSVMAARYNDGLLLDSGATPQKPEGALVVPNAKTPQTIAINTPGIYQVDVYAAPRGRLPNADPSRLKEGLSAAYPLDGESPGRLEGNAAFVDSPFGKAVSLDGDGDFIVIPRNETMNVAEGDFTVAVWIRPQQLRRAGIIGLGERGNVQGWKLEMQNDRGGFQLDTTGPKGEENGMLASPNGVLKANAWQHLAAVVHRGKNETRLFLNGYPVAKGKIGALNLDNPKIDLHLGRIPGAQQFKGELDDVRLYRRALGDAEIRALVEPGKQFQVEPPAEKPKLVKLTMGDRQFSGTLTQPAFLTVRLPAGPLPVSTRYDGVTELDRLVLTPLAAENELSRRLIAFEKRSPKLGVHLGLRRDCGSTFAPVGPSQVVTSGKLNRFVFEGAIANYPSPEVEKDNVNYLAGIREIAVRSEFTDGRDMPRLVVRSIEFEGPFYEQWPPATHRNIFIDFDRKADQQAYARHIIRNFATRAYRRPITPAEETSLMAVYTKSAKAGAKFEDSIKDTLQVVLTSPQFLFLTETSSTPKPEQLEAYELASKLSYFLWNGPPDRTTLQLAAAGTLTSRLDAEVDRMIASPRFERFMQQFTSQWLSLDKFSVLEPDRKKFPKLTRDTRAQLAQEPVQFVEHLIRNNLPVRNLIDSDFVMANEAVANYYDLGDKTESGFKFVPILHQRRELGGVLTQAAIMAGLSDGRESNPVKRGAWLARKIIAEPPADPPPNVPALKEETANLTLRQRLEQHRNQPGCQQCHTKIDPWGVALEEFDAGGRLKTQATDAHSKLPDSTEVSGINDLQRYLGEDRIDQVAFSVLKHLSTYASGRNLTYSELHQLKKDGLKLKAGGYRMKDMVHFVVHSPSFLEK